MTSERTETERMAGRWAPAPADPYTGPERRVRRSIVRRPARSSSLRYAKRSFAAMALDAVVVLGAIALGISTWISLWGGSPADRRDLLQFGLFSIPLWIWIFHSQSFYRKRDDVRFISDIRRVTSGVVLSSAAFILLGWPVQVVVPRGVVAVVVVTLIPALLLEREVLRLMTRGRRRSGRGLRPVVILGTNDEAVDLARQLADPILGRQVAAFISTKEGSDDVLEGLPVLRGPNPAIIADSMGAESVVIAATALEDAAPSAMLRSFLDRGIEIEMTSAITGVARDRISVDAIGVYPLLSIQPGYRGGWRAGAKRCFDVLVAGLSLLLVSPILVAAGIAVCLDSPGGAIFAQERLGRRATRFRLYKIRTMQADAEQALITLLPDNESDGPLFKMEADPRITRVGRFLRRTSIDELPQLWNVIRGDMSLVGPRPAIPSEADEWTDELRNRLRVRPGITGMWQVNGRSATSFHEYQRLDLFYIDNWSMLTDIGILFRTIPAVLARKGAS